MNHLDRAMTIMSEEFLNPVREPLEKRVADRLVTDLGIDQSEAEAYAAICFERYVEAYSK